MSDITAIFYTANVIKDPFASTIRDVLEIALDGIPLISVSHKEMNFGENIVVDLPRHHLSIYRQALIGALAAKTKYIVFCEDDVFYSPEHFDLRPKDGFFGYDMSNWSIYTWSKTPLFSYKDRRTLNMLICERELFIDAMNERFEKYPTYDGVDLSIWAEPGKYERQLGVTVRETEKLYTPLLPSVTFSHEDALAFENLGARKRLGNLKVFSLPLWGTAEEVMEHYA